MRVRDSEFEKDIMTYHIGNRKNRVVYIGIFKQFLEYSKSHIFDSDSKTIWPMIFNKNSINSKSWTKVLKKIKQQKQKEIDS